MWLSTMMQLWRKMISNRIFWLQKIKLDKRGEKLFLTDWSKWTHQAKTNSLTRTSHKIWKNMKNLFSSSLLSWWLVRRVFILQANGIKLAKKLTCHTITLCVVDCTHSLLFRWEVTILFRKLTKRTKNLFYLEKFKA